MMLRVAFGKVDYTPPLGTRLGRLGINAFISKGVVWPIHARVALFDDGTRRAAVVVLDNNFVGPGVVASLREAMRDGAGVEPGDCLIAATHTHNGPSMFPWKTEDPGYGETDRLAGLLVTLGKSLVAALEPATLHVALTQAPGWSWNRRPVYRDGDREWVGTHGPRQGPGAESFVRLEDADETALRVLVARRADGSAIGGLVSFWCHPTCMYGEAVWSADFPGPLLDKIEREVGGAFVFLNGPAGDLSQNGMLGDGRKQVGADHARQMGESLAAHAIAALPGAARVRGDRVRVERNVPEIAQRMVTRAQIETARHYLANEGGKIIDPPLMQRLHGWRASFFQRNPVTENWLAEEILGMWEWQRRVALRVTREAVELQSIGVGDFAISAFPCELFSGLGRELVARSPVKHTWPVEMANGFHGYIPPRDAFARGGYECCLGWQSRLDPEAGHVMVNETLATLARLA